MVEFGESSSSMHPLKLALWLTSSHGTDRQITVISVFVSSLGFRWITLRLITNSLM